MWGYGPYGGMMAYGGWGMGAMMLIGGVLWLVVLALVVMAVVGIVRAAAGHRGPYTGRWRSSGLALLEERYAHGEIGRDEYLQKKRDILGRRLRG